MKTHCLLTPTAFVRGLGLYGWHRSRYARALKSALFQYRHFHVLASSNLVARVLSKHDERLRLGGALGDRFSSAFETWDIDWHDLYGTALDIAINGYEHGTDETHITLDAAAEHFLASLLVARKKRDADWFSFLEHSNDLFTLSFLAIPLSRSLQSNLSLGFSLDVEEVGWQYGLDEASSDTIEQPASSTLALADSRIPDWSTLPWQRIATLAKSGAIDSVVKAFSGTSALRKQDFEHHLAQELWRFARQEAPTDRSAILRGVAASIPVPPVNPLAVWFALKDLGKWVRFSEQYPFLFMALEIERLTNSDLRRQLDESIDSADREDGRIWWSNVYKNPGSLVLKLLDPQRMRRVRLKRSKCRGITSKLGPCQRAAGWGTDHVGFGLCRDHYFPFTGRHRQNPG